MNDEWIWMCRWEDFQHYRLERDRAPAWIKHYTKQLDDDRYLSLTETQRAILHDLRIAFAKAHGRLPTDTRKLSNRIALRVTTPSLNALIHAGFIEFVSRQTLEQRLESLYSSPRAPARSKEVEVEIEDLKPLATTVDTDPPAPPRASPNGPVAKRPTKQNLINFARQFWDEYPDKTILQVELTDRGATTDEAEAIVHNEATARASRLPSDVV